MASEVKTNKISPATSGTVTLGDSSDVFQLPASAEIDIASGATLDVNGTIDLTGATTTGFPAGGLTHASQWRVTADFTGDAAPISINLAAVIAAIPSTSTVDPTSSTALGAPMEVLSGVFTFPSTGYWLVSYTCFQECGSTFSPRNDISIYTTANNSAYIISAETNIAFQTAALLRAATTEIIFDVTDTTQCKCRFHIDVQETDVISKGNSAKNETFFTFIKLADT